MLGKLQSLHLGRGLLHHTALLTGKVRAETVHDIQWHWVSMLLPLTVLERQGTLISSQQGKKDSYQSHIPLVDFPQAQVLDPLDLLNTER